MPLFLDTLRALAAPRRAVPIALLAGALLAAQAWTAHDRRLPIVATACVLLYLASVPFLWRAWRPADPARPTSGGESFASAPAFADAGSAARAGETDVPPGSRHLGSRRSPRPLAGAVLFSAWAAGTAMLLLLPRLFGVAPTFFEAGVNGAVVGALYWVGGWGLARDIDQEQGLRRERARADLLARQAEHAQLLAMKAHLDPHFLFNTLNAIAAWCAEDPKVAEAALLRLAGVLREVMGGVRLEAWPLERELALVRDVAELYGTRDPERFRLEWAITDVPPISVPPLLLLPVIENAFVHGPGKGHAGAVRVELQGAEVRVTNPGRYAGPRPGGEGLSLVERRAALMGGRFRIASENDRTVATITLGSR